MNHNCKTSTPNKICSFATFNLETWRFKI